MTVIEILELLIPFSKSITTASHVRHQLKDVDLEALIQAERTRDVVRPIKPEPAAPPLSSVVGEREYYHLTNTEGKRCFDQHIRRERAEGVIAADKGSPAFPAKQSLGRCNECGESIQIGDMIIIRQGGYQEQNVKK